MDEIIASIMAEFGPLSAEAVSDIKRVGEIRQIKKGETLVREGEYSYLLS